MQVIGFAMLSCLVSLGCEASEVKLSLSKERVQEKVEGRFPMTHEMGSISVKMTDPVIDFDAGPNRIGLSTALDIGRQGGLLSVKGSSRSSGEVVYNPDDATFYLTDPKIEDLELPLKLLGEERRQKILDATNASLIVQLEDIPLHTFDERPTSRAAKALVKRVEIHEDTLHVVVGFD